MLCPIHTFSWRGIFLYISESLHIVLLTTPSQNFPTKLAELRKIKSQLQSSFWQTKVPAVHAHNPSPPPISSCPHFPELTEICLYSTWVRQVHGPYWVFPGTSVTQTTKKSLSNHREAKKSSFSPTSSKQEGTEAFLTSACTINTASFRFIIMGHFPISNCLLTWTKFFTMYLHLIIQQAWLSWVLIIINTLPTSL